MNMSRHKKIAIFLVLALLISGGYWTWRHFIRPRSAQPTPSATVSPIRPSEKPLSQKSEPKLSLPNLAPKRSKLDEMIKALQERLKAYPSDLQSYNRLASAYIQKAREVNDPAYYTKTEALLRKALELQPKSFEAMTMMGAVCLSRHQFREALSWGEKAKALAPRSSTVYGVIADAQVELGDYEKAVESLQKMVDLRPDLASYSRISYIRELMGEVEGAIEAMKMAIKAGGMGAEARAWCLVQLGNLYFNSGKTDLAEAEYQKALVELPNYVHALAGRARVQAANKNFAEAMALYTQVVQVMPSSEYVIALGDIYRVSGQTEKAEQQYALVRAMEQLDKANGVDTDLEMALFDADHDHNLSEALGRARQAFEHRPSIHAADVLAWTLYKTGGYAEAYKLMRQALRLGTKDALFLFHAGMICKKLGKHKEARHYLEQAFKVNPHFSILYAQEALNALQELRKST
jgi:tetratricopeptide (TPR) repeat protein